MYYYLKKAISIYTVIGISLFSAAVTAIPAPANSFKITNFRFGMEDPSYDAWRASSGATPIDKSQYGTLVEGTYQGSNSTNALINFIFYDYVVHVFTLNETESPPGTIIPGGPAPTVNLTTLTADMSSWFAEWNGTEFNQGNNTNYTACDTPSSANGFSASPNAYLLSDIAEVTDNFDGSYRINWNSCITGGSFNGKVGFWQLDVSCTTCPPTILGLADTLTASQNGGANTNTATITGGDIVITSSFGVTPAGFGFSWKASDPAIVDTDSDIGTFTFDPSGLVAGNYVITANFEDSNTSPDPTRGTGEMIIRLVNTATGDVADSNANRIENKDDAGLLPAQLQALLGASNSTYALQSSSGSLRVGKTAFCAGKAARITSSDVDENANKDCSPMLNSSDRNIKAVGIGGYYDFEVSGITKGETVDIVIPLTEPVPKSAVYRKYTLQNGWSTFVTEGNDKLSSATSISPGVCPEPTSDAYTAKLSAGDDCVRLSITDGGTNDVDHSANGLIKDPGGVAQINSGTEANLSSGCSLSGQPASLKSHAEWLLVFAVLAWLGLTMRYRKQ